MVKEVPKREKRRKVNNMEDLLFNKVLGGEELIKDILNTDNVSSIRDQTGKSYWWDTIDKKKKYQVEKYEYERALQNYPIISYINLDYMQELYRQLLYVYVFHMV